MQIFTLFFSFFKHTFDFHGNLLYLCKVYYNHSKNY